MNVLVSGEQYKFWICTLCNFLSLPLLRFSSVQIQALYNIWPILLVTLLTVLHGSSQHNSHNCTNMLSVGVHSFSLENLLKHHLWSVSCACKHSDYSLWANCMSCVVDSPAVLLIILIAPQLVIAQDEIRWLWRPHFFDYCSATRTKQNLKHCVLFNYTHQQAHSKHCTTHAKKHDMLPQHQVNITK